MRRKWIISLVFGVPLAIGIGVATLSKAPRKPEVQMMYVATATTNANDSIPRAVFKVVNSGRKSAHIRFANVARKDGDEWRYDLVSMAILEPSCTVGPRTNCTTSIHFPFNSRPGIWRVEAVVFERSSFIKTTSFAVRRLWARASGKAKYNQFWVPNYVRAYEINSTDIPGVALNLWDKAPAPRKKEFWSPDYNWTESAFEPDPPVLAR